MSTGYVDLLPAVAVLTDPGQQVDLAMVGALVGLSPSRAQRDHVRALTSAASAACYAAALRW